MLYYTDGDYVYLNNNIDAPKEHHNQLTLNQELDFYITLLPNLIDETLTLFTNLFVNKMEKNGRTNISNLRLS